MRLSLGRITSNHTARQRATGRAHRHHTRSGTLQKSYSEAATADLDPYCIGPRKSRLPSPTPFFRNSAYAMVMEKEVRQYEVRKIVEAGIS